MNMFLKSLILILNIALIKLQNVHQTSYTSITLESEVFINNSYYSEDYDGITWQEFGNIYFQKTQIGSLFPEDFALLIDTGQSYSWINKSVVDHPQKSNKNISYSNYMGQVQGLQVTDYVSFRTASSKSPIHIDNFTFIYSLSDTFYDREAEGVISSYGLEGFEDFISSYPKQPKKVGVLGLGPKNSQQPISFTDQIYEALKLQQMNQRYFSFYLKANPYEVEQDALIMFGSYNSKYIKQGETFNYEPVANIDDGWTINLKNYQLYNETYNLSNDNNNYTEAILASGVQFIGIPTEALNNIVNSINNLNKGISCGPYPETGTITCYSTVSDIEFLPDIELTTQNGQTLVISKSYYLVYWPQIDSEEGEESNNGFSFNQRKLLSSYNPLPFSYPWMTGWPTDGTRWWLWFQDTKYVTNNQQFWDKWILGVPFLQNYYTIFNETGNSIGFVLAEQPLFSER